jgi:hypothetical protein
VITKITCFEASLQLDRQSLSLSPMDCTGPKEPPLWHHAGGNLIVAAIRTVLIGMSRMFRDIVKQSVAKDTTLEIVGELKTCESLEERVRFIAPELILIGLGPGDHSDLGKQLLAVVPTAKVIVFSRDKRHAHLYEMCPNRVSFFDISPEELRKAIKGEPIAGRDRSEII